MLLLSRPSHLISRITPWSLSYRLRTPGIARLFLGTIAMAALHPFLTKDAHHLLEAFAPTEEKTRERAEALQRVRDALATENGGTDVLDVSMWVYANDVDAAPLDLAVVDTQFPRGRPPHTGGSPSDDATTMNEITTALLAHGFAGTFPSPTPTRSVIPHSRNPRDPVPTSTSATDIPWADYTPPPRGRTEIVYPATLSAQTPTPFTLMPPAPTLLPLIELLKSYTALSAHIQQTIALAYIWLRSWGVHEITPLALALLVVKFIQETAGVRPLLPDGREGARTVWVRFNAYNRRQKMQTSETVELDASFCAPGPPPAELANQRLGPAFHAFLKWFAEKKFHSKAPVNLSIHTPRMIHASLPTTNTVWADHQLIIRDPFVLTHNHAARVSRQTLHHTYIVANTAASVLSRGSALTGVFGPYLLPPRASAWFGQTRAYHKTRSRSKFAIELETTIQTPHSARSVTLRRVEAAIHGKYGRKFSIGLFGSTQYGVDAPTSDLDLVVIDADRMQGFTPDVKLKRLPAVYDVQDLATTLRKRGFRILRVIPQASVPIVKFLDPDTNLYCDINVNDQLGIHNTALIRAYCDLHPVVRPIVRALKRWARPLGLNDPGAAQGAASFSSYALVLMVVGRLQMRGLLPNLQDMGPVNADVDMDDAVRRGAGADSFWLRMRDGRRLQCDTRWRRPSPSRPSSPASSTPESLQADLHDALLDWFQ
ncbi:hypothetical protein EVG20_g9655 [Dentipellis fragilis]|uniref:Poly(A) RNA polymerase mitochondrial-like central palm domain-containing protein n=1 Tax=Dentipellis fragilis TaxID=205917 RepID=A0A4Y9XWP2_9AGAM|nr:hypothetical protein EVG20_g9655 [Dentipellis fragilis]